MKSKKCSYDPSKLIGVPMGMFHCPECGEMVLAGYPHPDYSLLEKQDDEEEASSHKSQ